MYKLFLCLRYLLHRRIVVVPIVAVMLCVAMNLIVVSIMGGFLDKVRSSVRGLFGDIIIGNGSLTGFGYYDTYTDAEGKQHPGLLQYLAQVPEIKQATPVIESYAILRLPENRSFTNPVRVLGIVPDQYAVVTDFEDGLYWQKPARGEPASFEPDSYSDRKRQADAARKAGDAKLAADIEEDLAQEIEELKAEARVREQSPWEGAPHFGRIPNIDAPGSPPVPLSTVVTGVDDPQGIFVGIRVFWSAPDSKGHFKRQRLFPGREKVHLTVWPMSARGTLDEKPEMKQFHLVDTSYSHIPQIDDKSAYVAFDTLQQCLRMNASESAVRGFRAPARATRVLVKLHDGVDLEAGQRAIKAAVDRWTVERRKAFDAFDNETRVRAIYFEPFDMHGKANVDVSIWEEANRDYFSAISIQRFIALAMVGIVSLTVIALIWVIFIMIVVEKTKDIGIIKSVGGSASGVSLIFVAWAAVIGAIGSALGGSLAWVFIGHINQIEQWLSAVIGKFIGDAQFRIFMPSAYLFESIPARVVWGEYLWIVTVAILAAMLGALLPAWRAGRMNPVEALRYE